MVTFKIKKALKRL